MDDDLRRRLQRLPEELRDPDERLEAMGRLSLPLYSHELASTALEVTACDARANQETWGDMIRMQEDGFYPAAFAAINVPVIMLHGAVDPHPGRMIRASLEGERLRCEIEDTGVGICTDDRHQIFDEFFQVDEATSRRFTGAGLGLTLVRDLVVLLEGDIAVRSEIGAGSTFSFSIPVQTLG